MFYTFVKSIFITIISTISLAACFEEPKGPIRVGTNIWPGYEPAYIAQDLGYFANQNVKLNQFQSASESIRAFRNDAVDVVAVTLGEALLLLQDGIDIKVFLVADISNGGDVILGSPNINNINNLKGHRVGVVGNSLGAYILVRALEIHKIPFDAVKLVHLTVDTSEEAFAAGEVDAVVSFEPYRSRLMQNGAREIFSSREMPNEIVDILVVRTEYAENNSKELKQFSKAWLKAVNYIVGEPEKAALLVGKHYQLSPEKAFSSFDGLILPNYDMNVGLLNKTAQINLSDNALKIEKVLVKHGLLNAHIPLDDIFTDSYIH